MPGRVDIFNPDNGDLGSFTVDGTFFDRTD
jgi:hypothetical protein